MDRLFPGQYDKTKNDFFKDFKDAFELSNDDLIWLLNRVKKDDIGFTHFSYQQYYKNHRVVYGEYIIHQQPDGIVKSAMDVLLWIKSRQRASVTRKTSLGSALQFYECRQIFMAKS